MLGWIVDSTARAACRSADHVLGHLPQTCLTDAGRPLLTLAAGVILALAALVWAVRKFRA